MNEDVKAEEMISTGMAVNAEFWLLEKPGKRRIGETAEFHKDSSLKYVTSHDCPNIWVSGFRVDADGCEFAEIDIYELPKTKRMRRALFKGMNIRMALSEMPLIVDVGQKYIICKTPTAAQVIKATEQIRKLR